MKGGQEGGRSGGRRGGGWPLPGVTHSGHNSLRDIFQPFWWNVVKPRVILPRGGEPRPEARPGGAFPSRAFGRALAGW